jgi:phosphoglycolate phosphatase
MNTRNTVIFDLDGTLLDTLDDLTASVNYCMEKYGGPIHDREEVRGKVGNGIYVLMEKALPEGRNHPQYEACMKDFPIHYKAHMMDHTKPFPGILTLLKDLQQKGYRMAIVSNKFDAAVKLLNQDFFSEYISVAIGESPTVHKKPAPDTVFQAMKELGADPQECIYVGDSEVDIQTAANAGIPCISVDWGFKTVEFLKEHGAKTIVSTPEELLDTIEKAI